MTDVTVRICFNCKDVARFRFFCVDCWRMAAFTTMAVLFLMSGGGELLHQLLPALSVHEFIHLVLGEAP